VAIARALAGGPGLILADEPTGALDSATGEEIMSLFDRLNREQGQTIVLITHDPKVAGGCRRRLSMRDGRLDEMDRPPQPFRPVSGHSPGVMDAA
jgi:putative ABC transport system ATP-binding protein